jgi:Biotin carboxyl carrier protein
LLPWPVRRQARRHEFGSCRPETSRCRRWCWLQDGRSASWNHHADLRQAGRSVKKGDKLLMYEAMKMENNLLAEADGTITAINCRQGDNVLQGDTLIVIG